MLPPLVVVFVPSPKFQTTEMTEAPETLGSTANLMGVLAIPTLVEVASPILMVGAVAVAKMSTTAARIRMTATMRAIHLREIARLFKRGPNSTNLSR